MRGALLVVRSVERDGAGTRWGFVASKKVAPTAVRRNRIRRVLRAAARESTAPGNIDVVASVTKRGAAATASELRREFASLLNRVRTQP